MDLDIAALNITGSDADDAKWATWFAVRNDTDSHHYYEWLNSMQPNSSFDNITFDIGFPPRQRPTPTNPVLLLVYSLMKLYYTPLIIGLGVCGNTITWLIFLRSKLRSLSSSHYLAAITMVNTLYLLSLLIHWLFLLGIDIYNRPGWCQFINFITKASTFLSVWYMAAFCIDRYICICWPTEAPKMCTRMRARVVIICLLCMGIVVFMNISLTVGVLPVKGRDRCTRLPIFHWHLRVLEVFDLVVNLGLPYMTVIVLTLLIVANTFKVRKHRVLTDDPAQIRSVTIVFLVMCIVCHLPSELFRVVNTTGVLSSPSGSVTFTYNVLRHLFHTSLATHFVVFVICYPMFAQTCKTPFNWVREKMVMKFRKAPNGDINLRNVRFHAVQDEPNVAHV